MTKNDRCIRVLGIDPSTTNMGITIIDIDLMEIKPFKLVYVNTIKGDKVNYIDSEEHYEPDVALRCLALSRAYTELLEIYEPDAVVCEDNFLGKSADTFKRLIGMVCLLQTATRAYSRKLHLVNVLPNITKAIVGANFGGTQKEHVVEGIRTYPRLDLGSFDINTLDDHSTDSIIIACWLGEQLARGYDRLPYPHWVPKDLNPNKDKVKSKGKRRGGRKRRFSK